MIIKDAGQARQMYNQTLKKKRKGDIRSKRVQAIYSTIKTEFEQCSHISASEPFQGTVRESAVLQNALDELAESRSLNKKTEDALMPIFKRRGWPFPAEDEEDSSRRFNPGHGWHRELKKRVAEIKKGSGTGGSDVIGFEPDTEAALAGTEEHVNRGAISDKALQDAYKAIRKCGKGI